MFVFLCSGFIDKKYNPATKKDDLIFISDDSERAIGAKMSEQVEKTYKESDDSLICARVEKIGERLAAVADRPELRYRFKVLKADEPDNYNAFALPGGYVYIFDALVNKLDTDDEIAAVLAHELGHVAARHSIKKLQSAIGMNALMLLSVGMSRDSKTINDTNYALNQLMVAYSREAEEEADKLSVEYLRLAGYNANAVIEALEFMQYARKKGKLMKYTFFRTHPYISERIARARKEILGYEDFDSYINLPGEGDDF